MAGEIKISRSKIELFIECQRCFWLDAKYKIKRPEGIKGTYLGSKYDSILKNEFDKHRQNNTKPQELDKYNFDLYSNLEKLKKWRNDLGFYHLNHKIYYYGKIDDLLINKEKELIPFDFKTTLSKNKKIENYENYYKRQLEIYGYFLKKQKEQVINLGILYVIEIEINENFEKIERRELIFVKNLNYDIYDEILDKLKEVYFSAKEPTLNPKCEYCLRDFRIKNLN